MKKLVTLGCAALAVTVLTAFLGVAAASASFHSGKGNYLEGHPQNGTYFSMEGAELACNSSLQGSGAGVSNTQDLHPSIECFMFGTTMPGNTEGCQFRFDSFEEATLHSCSKGGIELTYGTAPVECVIIIPNQTVPVAYQNGSENKFLEVNFSKTEFKANVPVSKAGCPFTQSEGKAAHLSVNYKVTGTEEHVWFDSSETLPSAFHTAASATIEGAPAEGSTTFVIANQETVKCQVGQMAGKFAAAESAEALGPLAISPATGPCVSSYFEEGASVDATGCRYVFHANGTADLESCGSGGIVIRINNFVAQCRTFIPNQAGKKSVSYRNHGVNGLIGVRASENLSLSGEVVESRGICPYKRGQAVSVSQQSTVDFLANGGATELWFG